MAQSTEAQAAYQAGEYDRALGLAIAEDSVDSLAFAARVVLAQGIGADPIDMHDDRLAEAQKFAEQAIAINPEHHEARLQQAITLSLRAREIKTRRAFRARLGRRARALGEAVARDAPENVYAHGFLAVWHLEAIRHGGRLGALVLGASMTEARGHYRVATGLAPFDAALHWQWARALAATNPDKYAADIEVALLRVRDASPTDRLSQVLKARASALREALKSMSADEVRKMAAALL